MVGIYKITNLINGKSYVGQSTNIENRIKAHKTSKDTELSRDIHKYGEENFSFEVLEECKKEELDNLERFYIFKYDSIRDGYNKVSGGQDNNGTSNSNHKLSVEDVYMIREDYKNHVRKWDSYEKYKDKVSKSYFSNLWSGVSWKGIHSDVYTEENLNYYKYEASKGEKSTKSVFTDYEVFELRKRYVDETAKEIYESVKDRCSYQALQCILWGRYYSDLPIYDKRKKEWIND